MSSSLLESVLVSRLPSPSLCSTSMTSLPSLLTYGPICKYTQLQNDKLTERQIATYYIKKHKIQNCTIPIDEIIINYIFYCRLTHWNKGKGDLWTNFLQRYRRFKRTYKDNAEGEYQDISDFIKTLSPTEKQTYSTINVPPNRTITEREMKTIFQGESKRPSMKTSPSPSGSSGAGCKAGGQGFLFPRL
jgi:hypothetical protein